VAFFLLEEEGQPRKPAQIPTCIEFDFPAPPCLHSEDLLALDDGKLVEVVADIEPVLELRANNFAAIARPVLALGNRHVPVQILINRIRLQDHHHSLAGLEGRRSAYASRIILKAGRAALDPRGSRLGPARIEPVAVGPQSPDC
jgi:hypothetical protein